MVGGGRPYTAMTENGLDPNGQPARHCHREDEESEPCGWGSIQPASCQRFRDPKWILFWLSWIGAIQGMVVNGFVNVVISNIERRYDLSSTESGTVASCYDIASVLCLIPVSYFGGLGRKPRYLGIGAFFMGLGSFVFALPHFMSGAYNFISMKNTCQLNSNTTNICDATNAPESLSLYKYIFFFGQLLHGAGASPLYTLGVTYLDDNLPVQTSPVYIAIFYSLAIVGPALGYLMGGKFLDLYVDINRVDPSSIGMNSGNAKFVGAWWIGFLISGTLALIVSLPMCGFPRELTGASKYRLEREAEVYHRDMDTTGTISTDGFKLGWKDILKSLKVLLSNPTFMFLNCSAACEGILLSGFATFAPKFIESQFSLSASTAAVYVGYAAIPAGGGGTFIGGCLVRVFKLKIRGIIRLCLGLSIAMLAVVLVFLVQCETVSFAGVNAPYRTGNSTPQFVGGYLISECNTNCRCSQEQYNPVCGKDGLVYFSPCFAGCQTEILSNTKKYVNCSCIQPTNNVALDFTAVEGKCPNKCGYLSLFMPFFAIIMLLTFIISMPALTATLRCVPQQQRSLGLGIQWIVARCLGSIPGPILFGQMIDLTCMLWQRKCDEQGSCHFYDNKRMGLYLMALTLVVKSLSSFFFFLSLCLYKVAPNSETHSALTNDSTSTSALSSFSRTTRSDQSMQSGIMLTDEVLTEKVGLEENEHNVAKSIL